MERQVFFAAVYEAVSGQRRQTGEVAELAEGAPLLREYGSKRLIVGSNPTLSAETGSRARHVRLSLILAMPTTRRGGRAVECTGLENQRALAGTVGSNPTPSALRQHDQGGAN